MVNLTYHLARSVETVSWCVGAGDFEVNTHYLCHSCASASSTTTTSEVCEVCEDCQDSYLDELCVLEYSDAFERRLNLSIGVASIILGAVAGIVNVGEAFWSEGDLVSWLTQPLAKFLVQDEDAYPWILLVLTSTWLLALTCLVANTLVACFLLALNPLSRRHYRNMNMGVYTLCVVQGFLFLAVYCWGGMSGMEAVFVGAPIGFGSLCVGCAACVGLNAEDLGVGPEGEVRLEEVKVEESV